MSKCKKFKTVKPGCRLVMKMYGEVTRNGNKEGDREGNPEPGAGTTKKNKKISWRLRGTK